MAVATYRTVHMVSRNGGPEEPCEGLGKCFLCNREDMKKQCCEMKTQRDKAMAIAKEALQGAFDIEYTEFDFIKDLKQRLKDLGEK